jgi:flagellar biosynthesis chaperone FliJ
MTSAEQQRQGRRARLTAKQIAHLRFETMLCERTIRAWAEGRKKMQQATLDALAKAAVKCGIVILNP